jgi:copper resistance protein B
MRPLGWATLLLLMAPTIVRGQSDPQTHVQHGQAAPSQPAAAHDHSRPSEAKSDEPLPAFIPALTDADRRAAFPDVTAHAVHDNVVNYFVLFDQLEWLHGSGASALNWDNKGWVGKDRNRLWFRSEGERNDRDLERAEAHLFYGRAIRRWWDLVVGVR